jgi:hypothetical protein
MPLPERRPAPPQAARLGRSVGSGGYVLRPNQVTACVVSTGRGECRFSGLAKLILSGFPGGPSIGSLGEQTMSQAFNHHLPRVISCRQACGLFAKAGVASVFSTVPLRDLGQGSTSTVTGKSVPALRDFDALLLDYLKQNKSVPGASLAIARDGRVIYARGFGWADVETRQAVQPNSLFSHRQCE